LLDFEQPAEEPEVEAPIPEALEWKEEELPDWIKELTDSAPTETPPASLEAEQGLGSTEDEILQVAVKHPRTAPVATTWIPEPGNRRS
jgi:hypothetical protein